MELQAKVKDFTSGKKFVNELTRDAINAQFEEALNNDANKGKSLDDLLKEITDGKSDIFKDDNVPTPPVVPAMGGKSGKSEDAQARAVMGLPPIKD